MIESLRRSAGLSLIVWMLLIAAAPAAWADAAGPTDYRTDIVSVEPATSAFEVSMIGGDSFMRLEQLEPVEIVIVGYRGEDYLRFDADGTVVENRRSPSTWLNEERYGTEDALPSFVDHEAPPQWSRVADNGRYAWHDHRSHWMNPQQPPGADAGDQVLEATVPLRVDGQDVTITVASYLLDDPPVWPGVIGAVLAAALGVVGLRGGRVPFTASVLLVAGLALVLGAVAFRSVPPETEPERLLWLLPLVAVVALLVVTVVYNRLATTVYLDGLGVVAGATLIGWGVTRFDALSRSLIPSDAPANLDRLAIGAALIVGAISALRGFWGLAKPERLIEPSPIEAA